MTLSDSLLQVDLQNGRCQLLPLPWSAQSAFLGGRGFNVGYLFKHLCANTDPLGAENILLFSCGLLTGSSAPASSRLHVNALSPLTGMLGSSNIGGYVGAWLRSCGIHSIILNGRSRRPVLLYVNDRNHQLLDAKREWGLDCFQTQEAIHKRFGQRVKILTIGPAGENRVRFACIVSGRDHAAGRTGLGAVMGAKNLKAIVIAKGDKSPFTVSSSVRSEISAYAKRIRNAKEFKTFSQYGSSGYVQWADAMGIVGVRNYTTTHFAFAEQIDGHRLAPKIVRRSGCFRCPVQCKADLKLSTARSSDEKATRPEFEPMLNLGAKCGLDDVEAIVRLDNLCTRLGLDATSAATAISFAMQLYEKQKLTPDDTGELKLEWGNAGAMEQLLKQMAHVDGLGRILGQGVKRAAREIGNGAEAYAAHVKGLETTAYHPGAIFGTALGYAISSRGGDYNNIYASLEYTWKKEKAVEVFGSPEAVTLTATGSKGKLVRRAVLVNIALDSLGFCKIPALSLMGTFDLIDEAKVAGAVLQTNVSAAELLEAADRIVTLERLFNLRHAPDNDDHRLPPLFYHSPGTCLTPEILDSMVQDFYDAMGWDNSGRPSRKKMAVALDPLVHMPSPAPQNSEVMAHRFDGQTPAGHTGSANER